MTSMECCIEQQLAGRKPSEVKQIVLHCCCRALQISGLTNGFVNLETVQLSSIGLTTLIGFPALPLLKRVNVSGNELSGTLDQLWGCPQISHLDLSFNKFCDPASLIPLTLLKQLTSLTLYGCPVTYLRYFKNFIFESFRRLQCLDCYVRDGIGNAEDSPAVSDDDFLSSRESFSDLMMRDCEELMRRLASLHDVILPFLQGTSFLRELRLQGCSGSNDASKVCLEHLVQAIQPASCPCPVLYIHLSSVDIFSTNNSSLDEMNDLLNCAAFSTVEELVLHNVVLTLQVPGVKQYRRHVSLDTKKEFHGVMRLQRLCVSGGNYLNQSGFEDYINLSTKALLLSGNLCGMKEKGDNRTTLSSRVQFTDLVSYLKRASTLQQLCLCNDAFGALRKLQDSVIRDLTGLLQPLQLLCLVNVEFCAESLSLFLAGCQSLETLLIVDCKISGDVCCLSTWRPYSDLPVTVFIDNSLPENGVNWKFLQIFRLRHLADLRCSSRLKPYLEKYWALKQLSELV